MRIPYILLCQDVESRNLLGIIDRFGVSTIPFKWPKFHLVFGVEGLTERQHPYRVAVSIIDPTDEPLIEFSKDISLRPDSYDHAWLQRHDVAIEGLTLQRTGRHFIEMKIEDIAKNDMFFDVVQIPKKTPTG